MNAEQSVPLWVLLILLGSLGTLMTIGIWVLVSHFREDQTRAERLAVVESEIKGIKAEIGDHTSGIRGWLHQLVQDWTPYLIKRQGERDT